MNRQELVEAHKTLAGKQFTREDLLKITKDLCEAARGLMVVKNSDYAGKGGESPFENFDVGGKLGIGDPVRGIMFRWSDKIKRMVNFVNEGNYQVKDESFLDTVLDMINYTVIIYAYLLQERKKNAS